MTWDSEEQVRPECTSKIERSHANREHQKSRSDFK
jgi:hypothetical protein